MVTRTTIDYPQHKKDVYVKIAQRYGVDTAKRFISFYANRYDKKGRSFIDYNVAFWLMDDYFYVKNIGTRWFAFVGPGGSGKTTLATNVFYYLDPSFKLTNAKMTIVEFINSMAKMPTVDAMKATYMDEPDDGYHALSMQGKQLRRIFGKARQQKMFLGICATDLRDIPTYIFNKIDGIFFCPHRGKCLYFKNRPRKRSYIIQDIRYRYAKEGYKVFFRLKREHGCLEFHTYKNIPYSPEEYGDYLKNKSADYRKDLDQFVKTMTVENVPPTWKRDMILLKLREKGWKLREITEVSGVDTSSVAQICKRYAKMGYDSKKLKKAGKLSKAR